MTAARKSRAPFQIPASNAESFELNHQELLADSRGFAEVSQFLASEIGMHLPYNAKNRILLASRMHKLCTSYAVRNYGKLMAAARKDHDVKRAIVSAMTTHTTNFFREADHFEFLKEQLPDLLAARRALNSNVLRVWCAAASSGEEAYSIAITLLEALPPGENWQIKILASDVDKKSLHTGATGIYSEANLEKVQVLLREKYFSRGAGHSTGTFRVKRGLRSLVTFAEFNLVESFYPFQHKFDVVFARNVFIYFEEKSLVHCIERIQGCVADDAVLFIGHSESLLSIATSFKLIGPAVYQLAVALDPKTDFRRRK